MYTTSVEMRKRITILLTLISMVLLLLMSRLAYLQFVKGNELTDKAIDNRLREVPVEARRGTIYDRNGKELAVSISSEAVAAEPRRVTDPEGTAAKLAPVLGMDKEVIKKLLTKKTGFVWIKRKVEDAKIKQLKQMESSKEGELAGIRFIPESSRYYPNDNLAAHVLGFATRTDAIGAGGIEGAMDKELKGIAGKIVSERDAAGREIPNGESKYIAPIEGKSLVLSIDETIQHFAERELDNIVQKYQPKHTAIIVMDPKTGEILALANRPDYNPNKYWEFDQQTWRNFGVSDSYEPGSTFKVITAAAALEEGAVRPGDHFYDPGYKEVLGKKIKCWKAGGHGAQTFVQVAENSCNPGFITVGLALGVDKFTQYLQAFGFGKQTEIELPGEATGILVNPKKATLLDLATMSIGQSNAVTSIQLVTAVAAVANDGVLMRPQLVREIRDVNGNVQQIQPKQVRQVISKSTARELRGILENVITNGTGINAYLEGYRAAGKTGTAQKAGPTGGYQQGKYVASFVGFAPADNPKIAALVVIDEPQGAVYYGGQIAAPAFKAVVGDALKYLGVPPQLTQSDVKDKTEQPKAQRIVPQLINLPLGEAQNTLFQEKLTWSTEGQGKVVLGQFPLPGAEVAEGTKVTIYLGQSAQGIPADSEVTVPSVIGKTLREAAAMLALTGLKMEPDGSGVAESQNIPPRTKVKAGTVVKVKFVPPTKPPDNPALAPEGGGAEGHEGP
ncbi:MAG: stage V sporulation protein D [Clostridia bacterium]|nr:stage V sporulation protein D [Clostridia bacterium]